MGRSAGRAPGRRRSRDDESARARVRCVTAAGRLGRHERDARKMISFRGIKKSFGEKRVLEGVSFDVQDGEVFFIIGASGVGKSVLIKHLVGLLYPDDGEIWLDGQEISKLDEDGMMPVRKKCAMVFQHSTLFDSMTCAENVALPLRKHKGLSVRAALDEAR